MKKTISIFVAVAFFCVSASLPAGRAEDHAKPLAGLDRAEAGPAPGFREVEPEKESARPGRKFPWPLVLGAAAGVAAGAFLLFTVCKRKDYDIRGTWEVSAYPLEKPRQTLRLVFKGGKSEGDYTGGSYGWYGVEGRAVNFGYGGHGGGWTYSGTFDSPDRMSGTFRIGIMFQPVVTGTWWARKISSAAGTD
jgi:hypothetical protein